MYNGKYLASSKHGDKRPGLVVLSLLLLLAVTVGGTLAYLIDKTGDVKNTFNPSQVTTEVVEKFDGATKTDVNVKNTGDIDAYLRVKLITYRVNDQEQHIGGMAEIPAFTPGEGWSLGSDGFYYYTRPVAPDKTPAANLIDSITLRGSYDDDNGGKQVIEVLAEAIQADGTDDDGTPAVELAWKNVKVKTDKTLTVQ